MRTLHRSTSDRFRLGMLAAVLGLACALVAAVILGVFYRTHMDVQTARLTELVRSQAEMIGGIVRQEQSEHPDNGLWRQHALNALALSRAHTAQLGESGVFLTAERVGDHIRVRHFDRAAKAETQIELPLNTPLAIPIRKVLSGESGFVVAPDYRGIEVLAAYRPLPELDMGLVVKIDAAEVRKPFLIAGGAAAVVGGLVTAIGILLFLQLSLPMLDRLELNERRYRELFEHMRSGVVVFRAVDDGADFQIIDANKGFEIIEGIKRQEVIGRCVTEIFPGAHKHELLNAIRTAWRDGREPVSMRMSFYEDERVSGWRDRILFRLPSGDVVDIYDDVTNRRTAEAGLQMAAAVFHHTMEGILLTDARGVIQRVNPAFTTITGYTAEEAVGRTPAILKSDRQSPDFYRAMWDGLQANGRWQGEIWNRRKDGEAYLEWLTINAIRDESGQIVNFVAVFDDISELHAKEQHIHHQAFHDALTGLPNRSLLMDRLQHMVKSADRGARQVAVLFLDLDRFKIINDSLGHDVGDELLKIAAIRLRGCVRKSDTVARLGGDEFVILATDWDNPGDVLLVGEKIVEAIQTPFEIDGRTLRVSASIGVAVYPDDGDQPQKLLKNADAAMYAVKADGRNGIRFFDSGMDAAALERLTLENALREALEQGQFQMHYQPKVRLSDGSMAGMEALIRWHHPEQGMISPAKFIPLAEETGLVVPLGDWVLAECCRQAAAWRGQGLEPGPIAVNISARQLSDPGFVARVAGTVAGAGLAPSAIDLEITETAVMDQPERAQALLEALAEMGFKVVLDDFGVGQSSLGYLKRLPISVLKMDRSFISDVIESTEAAALAQGIIQLAKALSIGVVAEGVETQPQASFLRFCGCQMAQGYLFAKPMPPDEVRERFLMLAAQ